MIKKILLVTSLIFGSLSYANAQTAPIDLSKGITVKQLNDAFSSKIDTSRIGQPSGIAGLDENGNLFNPIKNSTIDITNQIPSLVSCPIGSCPSENSELGPVYSNMNIQSKTSKLNGEGEMTLNVGMLVDSGNQSGSTTYGKLPLYVGMMQTTGAGTAWAFNTNAIRNGVPGGTNSINGLPGSGTPGNKGALGTISTYGYENDLTNWDDDVDTSGANVIEYYGHMQGSYKSTAYFNMDANMPDGVYGAKYGMVWQPNSVSDILINSNTNSNTGILFSGNNQNANMEIDGSGNVGLYIKGTKSLNDILISDNTPVSVSISGTHSSSSINDISTTPAAINLSGSYSLSAINTQSSSASQVLTMAKGQNICFSGSDYCLSVGNASNELSYTVSGNVIFDVDSSGNITTGRITSNSESHFSNGTFNDPDLGVTRDAKFGNSGIAVTGGIKTDNINVTNTLTSKTLIIPSATLSTLPSSPSIGMAYIVTDGRKPGESAGAGSGAYCVYDGKEWMNVSTGIEVTN